MANFYKLLKRYNTALEFYINVEKFLNELTINKIPIFVKENENRTLNPIPQQLIEAAFSKELVKEKMSFMKAQQWLLWNKIACAARLSDPYALISISQNHLASLQEYLLNFGVNEITSALMMLQSYYLITQELSELSSTLVKHKEIQQIFFYNGLSRLILKEKMYLHKVVELLYSIKLPVMKELYQTYITHLTTLTQLDSLSDFRSKPKGKYNKEKLIINEYSNILNKVKLDELKSYLMKINSVLEFDKYLKDHIRYYSNRGYAQRNTDYINFLNLQWILFLEPENTHYMKAYESALKNIEGASWKALYEYVQLQKLLMDLLRSKSEVMAMNEALKLCEYFVNEKKDEEKADLIWKVFLVIAKSIDKNKVDISSLFKFIKEEMRSITYISLISPFKDFNVDKVYFKTDGGQISLSSSQCTIKPKTNSFIFLNYKQFYTGTVNMVINNTELIIKVPEEILRELTRKIDIELIKPQVLRYTKNLLIFKIEKSYCINTVAMEIITEPLTTITKAILIYTLQVQEIPIKQVKDVYKIVLINLDSIKGSIYIAIEIGFAREDIKVDKVLFTVIMKQKESSVSELLKKSFEIELPKHIETEVYVRPYSNSTVIKAFITATQPVKIHKVELNLNPTQGM